MGVGHSTAITQFILTPLLMPVNSVHVNDGLYKLWAKVPHPAGRSIVTVVNETCLEHTLAALEGYIHYTVSVAHFTACHLYLCVVTPSPQPFAFILS